MILDLINLYDVAYKFISKLLANEILFVNVFRVLVSVNNGLNESDSVYYYQLQGPC